MNRFIIRKTYFIVCFFGVVLTFASCKKAASVYTIGISQCSNDEWRRKMNTEMVNEALLHQDVRLSFKTVEDNTQQQIQDIAYFITKKVDLIIVSPNEAAPLTPVLEKAYEKGIPIVLVDRKIKSDHYTAFIAADNYQIGKEVGNYVVNLLGGQGRVVELCGLEGSTSAAERHQGFMDVVRNYPRLKLVYQADAAWQKKIAGLKMAEALKKAGKIDLVFAQNDRMALGAYQVAEQAGRANEIRFLGIDALPGKDGGIEQVLDNKLKATFIYPTGGDKIIQLAMKIVRGKKFEKNNTLYTAVVDQTNARVFKLQSDEINEQQSKIGFLNERIDTFASQYNLQRYLLISVSVVVLLLMILFFFLFHAYRSKNRLNIELRQKNNSIEEQKNTLEDQRDQLISLSKELEEATHTKLMFFTNISHEFRTPLTLISGPVDTLLNDHSLTERQHSLLALVQKNTSILLKLINQVLDFRKYENGKLELNIETQDLNLQIQAWNTHFRSLIEKKLIHFEYQVDLNADYRFLFDPEKMERVYFNLLSNAFKFTPEKGRIEVRLTAEKQGGLSQVAFTVTNTGEGLSANDIQNIFERFYQVDSRKAGSGIGLALVKAIVELHGGTIEASNESGCNTFKVRLPFIQADTESHFQKPCFISPELSNKEVTGEQTMNDIFEENDKGELPTLLVVDDNPDIRQYIRSILHTHYRIVEAKDGEEGVQKAIRLVPDLVVSDVMMPFIDGISLCQKLKTELSTSHIPIILLTACSLDEQRIVGFESGADDYISKPFHAQVLEVRIRKLIENRSQLKRIYGEQLFSGEDKGSLNEHDKNFLDRFREIVENDLSNPELNIEDIGKAIGLSRVQLYRKLKSITNYAPNELLKIIRLNKAYQLISMTERSVSEVAYDSGFTSPSYFTKCFKEFYKESPSDLIKRVRK